MSHRIDPAHHHTPDDPRVFVFGSNRRGIHGAGAALYARLRLGAVQGFSEGLMGDRCYALPTCSCPGVPLTIEQVNQHVQTFLAYADSSPTFRFFVSPVGCGLAGFFEHQIAPLFHDAPPNCDLPPGWRSPP